MGLTDPEGNPIPADDPRLPTEEATQEAKDRADAIEARLTAMGGQIGPLADMEASLKAVVSLVIPPDGPIRRLYDHRLQVFRVETLATILAQVEAARKGPGLVAVGADALAQLRQNGSVPFPPRG